MKRCLQSAEVSRFHVDLSEGVYSLYTKTVKCMFYRCNLCKTSIIRHDTSLNVFVLATCHAGGCRIWKKKVEVNEAAVYSGVEEDGGEAESSVIAPETPKIMESDEIMTYDEIYSKLLKQFDEPAPKVPEIKVNHTRKRLRTLVSSSFYLRQVEMENSV